MKITQSSDCQVLHSALPEIGNDLEILSCAAQKRQRLRAWMVEHGYTGFVISRRDNFAWLTAGGDNRVLSNSEVGFGHLVLTPEHQYLVAHSMDGQRLLEEQVQSQGYQLVELRWHQGDPRRKALELAGNMAAADTSLEGAREVNSELGFLHFPLAELEIARLRWLGLRTGEILVQLSQQVHPGLSEDHIACQMINEFSQSGIELDVCIVGSDERIFKYRHPLPTRKIIDKYLLLHPSARRWGLHANVSRSIYFGDPPMFVRKAYEAAATIEGHIFKCLKHGLEFAEILRQQKSWYRELGYPGEWEFHFQGGPTAYQVVDATRCLTNTAVELNQAFDWFITVTGAKVEELSILTEQGLEVPSVTPTWPLLKVETPWGEARVVDLMER